MERAVLFILDMVAGHWVEGIKVPATGLCPPNIIGYVNEGLLPEFRNSVENGIIADCWNMENCSTPYGMRYLASGAYDAIVEPGIAPYCCFKKFDARPTILDACKAQYPDNKVGAFGSDSWMQTGWWKAADCTKGFGAYYSDLITMQHAFSWMLANPDWKMTLVYLAQYDLTGNCPLFKKDAPYTKDKHHSIQQLDKYLWLMKNFLMEMRWWDKTYLCVASDHACHYGCDIAVKEGRNRAVPEKDMNNYCSNHQIPHDCFVWDFNADEPKDVRSDCCRRTLFLISGGALKKSLRGVKIKRAEIIDFAPTVASLLKLEFKSQGKPVQEYF